MNQHAGIFNPNFYPTPRAVISKMIAKLQYDKIPRMQILEPSAGKGDILDYLRVVCRDRADNLFAIEIEPDLAAILKEKDYRIIGTDFLTYAERYHFDAIIMNPPFSEGVEHVLKAWEVVADGGQVVCILNAETVKNPHTAKRKLLAHIISQHGTVDFIGAAFTDAERRTSVDCALIHLRKPASNPAADFSTAGMRFDSTVSEEQFSASPLASANLIEALVHSYDCAARILVERHKLEQAYKFYLGGIRDSKNEEETKRPLNTRINELKAHFWNYVFEKTQLGKRATSKFREGFQKYVAETSQLAFSVDNVMQVLETFFANQDAIIQQCISDVFDKATAYHEKNVVHTEGWKTNKSWKIGPKIILPHGVFYDKWGFRTYSYGYGGEKSEDFFNDLDRACCFLTGKKLEDIATIYNAIYETIRHHSHDANLQKIDSEFFTITVFKKGTVHLVWKDRELLNTFNQTAAKHKNWIGAGF